ncbi:MAG: DUF11 domain-containing protein, partial [Methanobrevibacter sp.]|nr:DUF11 domain-containing protein [Methanobrevibacter sp.]
MKNTRSLLFILILFLIIFSTSFVSANDDLTHTDTNGDTLSASDGSVIDENSLNEINLDSIDQSSDSASDLVDDARNTDEIEDDGCLTYNEKAPVLGVSNDEPVLGAVRNLYGGTVQQIMDEMFNAQPGDIIYLNGGTYTGGANHGWWQNNLDGITVHGGSENDLSQMATFTNEGYTMFLSDCNLNNVRFENIKAATQLFWFAGSGSLTNCVINNCESVNQFMWMAGSNGQQKLIYNCNFTNIRQTYSEVGDGYGQLSSVAGINMVNCNFINTTSGHHGGAICVADESEWGPATIPTTITNTNFINITSRWFAVYIHGKFRTSPGNLTSPEIVDNCNFINCVGTGEYSGGLGISHSDIIVRNTNFTNCSGGQGSAIMVGGIYSDHDGFNGRNLAANNVTIDNCIFTGNIAKIENQTSSYSPAHGGAIYEPTGDAGAVFVEGNGTHIVNCLFDSNVADSGNGAAVYIIGQDTNIEGSTFINHECDNGTVYIVGANTRITGSTFKDNVATSNGAAVYIEGDNTKIYSSNFVQNDASNGGAVYIEGNNANLTSNTFNRNNASNQGGAVYIDGDSSWISRNQFTNNEAIPQNNSSSDTTGLGGAFYVNGDNTQSGDNNYSHNKARNGSAIYTSGNNFRLYFDNFEENQAWSYLLIITPDPEESVYNTTDVNVTVVHVGGDNIINAIHNNASNDQIHLTQVHYTHSDGDTIVTGWEVSPVDGAENSQGGTLLYQDDREYLQVINVQVEHEDGEVILPYTEFITDIYGQVNVTLTKPLRVGNYTVRAIHPEDWNYKVISNVTTFRVIYDLNLTVKKTATPDHVKVGETVLFTINVTNSGPTNATNVNITDIVPSQFGNLKCNDSRFVDNSIIIDFLEAGESVVFTINATALVNGTWTNVANATCNENDTVVNDTATVVVDPVVNLSINKTAVPDTVYV